MWSVEFKLEAWSAKCMVWSVEVSVECRVWSEGFKVRSVEFGVWSVECFVLCIVECKVLECCHAN